MGKFRWNLVLDNDKRMSGGKWSTKSSKRVYTWPCFTELRLDQLIIGTILALYAWERQLKLCQGEVYLTFIHQTCHRINEWIYGLFIQGCIFGMFRNPMWSSCRSGCMESLYVTLDDHDMMLLYVYSRIHIFEIFPPRSIDSVDAYY